MVVRVTDDDVKGHATIKFFKIPFNVAAVLNNEINDVEIAVAGSGRTHQKLSNEPRYRSPFIGDLTRGTF